MKKTVLIIVLLISAFSYSQEEAWVYFKDKPNSQYYLANPLQMLSQRALNRRVIQNIPLDLKDVPIHQPYIDQIVAIPGITVKASSKWMNCLHIRGSQAVIQSVRSLSFVDFISLALLLPGLIGFTDISYYFILSSMLRFDLDTIKVEQTILQFF
jgi:hypothetical protein